MENLFSIKNISFAFNGRKVIKDISFDIEKGRFYGILGPNGSGKSTLLDLMSGYRNPDTGEVEFSGKNIKEYRREEVSREIASVFQNFYINFGYTVNEVVMMGRNPFISRFSSPSREDIDIVEKTIEMTEIEKFRDRLITNLSGGERQRVVFARALAQNTKVLVLDEATSNLDINHTLKLMEIVRKRVKESGVTVIAVIQDINLASMYCDKIILLKDGKIRFKGDKENTLVPEKIRDIFGVETFIEKKQDSLRQVFFKRGVYSN